LISIVRSGVVVMCARIFRPCLFVIALWMLSTYVGASVNTEAMLEHADEIRSSNPMELRALLKELNAHRSDASAGQIEHLEYLNAYSETLSGNLEKAIRDAQKLMEESDDSEIKARTGALLVNVYAMNRQFTEGFRQLEQSLSTIDGVKTQAYREHVFGVAAVVYNQAGQYDLGRQYAEKVLAMTTSARAKCYAGQTRLEAIQKKGEASLGDAEFSQLIELCAGLKEVVVTNLVRAMFARKWAGEGKYVQAIDLLKKHLPDAKATNYPILISEFESLLGEYERVQGDLPTAEKHAQAAITAGGQLVAAYRTLYEIAKQRGDHIVALDYYQKYADADKAYLSDIKTREMAYYIVRNQSVQQSQQIELLNQQNRVLQLQQRVNEQKAQSSRLLILLLVVLIGSIGYWAIKTKRVQMSLRRMAETDSLTSIANRHYFTQQSAQSLVQAARAGEDVALVMFDLDHFKSINDRFGHDVGDWVLKKVSEHCRTFCRRVDYLGRIGGEEFAILLSGCDLRGATRVAEDCRVRIASIDTQPSGHKFLITASFGVTASSLSGYDLAKLLSHADKSLYRSKRAGRNRVSTFDGDTQPWTQLQVVALDGQAGPEQDEPKQERTPEVASEDTFQRLMS